MSSLRINKLLSLQFSEHHSFSLRESIYNTTLRDNPLAMGNCCGCGGGNIPGSGSGGVGAGIYGVPEVKSRIVKRDLNCRRVEEDGDLILPPFTMQPDKMIGR